MTDTNDLCQRLNSMIDTWAMGTNRELVMDTIDALREHLKRRWVEQGQYMRQMDKLEDEIKRQKDQLEALERSIKRWWE